MDKLYIDFHSDNISDMLKDTLYNLMNDKQGAHPSDPFLSPDDVDLCHEEDSKHENTSPGM